MGFYVAHELGNRNNSGALYSHNHIEAVKTLAQKKNWKSITVQCYEKLDGKRLSSLIYEIDAFGNVTFKEKKEMEPIKEEPKFEIKQDDNIKSMGFVMPFYAYSSQQENNEYKKQMEIIRTDLDKLSKYIGTSSTRSTRSIGSSHSNISEFNEIITELQNIVSLDTIDRDRLNRALDNMITVDQTCSSYMNHIKNKVNDLIKKASNSPQKGGDNSISKNSTRNIFLKRYILSKRIVR